MELLQKNDLIRTILLMPPLERIDLVDQVLQSFNSNQDNDFENLWAEESEQRIDGYIKGNISSIPADKVFNKINEIK